MNRRRWAWLAVVAVVVGLNALAPVGQAAFTGQTANPGDSFSAASSFCASLTPVWLTGFESGVASAAGAAVTPAASLLNTVTGSVAVDNGATRSGGYSLRVTKTNGSTSEVIKNNLGTSTTKSIRLAVRFESLPAGAVSQILMVDNTSGADLLLSYTPQRFQLGFVGGTFVTGPAANLVSGRWYRIDIRVDVGVNPRTADWRVDGAQQSQAAYAQAAAGYPGAISLGSSVSTDQFTANYDDVLVTGSGADYPLPNGNTLALVPNSYVGKSDSPAYLKHPDGTTDVGATSYQLIRDARMDSTADYVLQTTGSATDHWAEFGFDDVTRTGCINGVSAVVAARSGGTGANSVKTAVWDSGVERVIHNDSVATTTLQYRSAVITPASGLWDAARLSAVTARLGYYRVGGDMPVWDALRLEYDQVPNATSVYANTVLADSPASYWRFGDASSSATSAAAVGATSGTYTNGPVREAGGAVGDLDTAVAFDGVDDYITMGNVYDFVGSAPFTAEAWIRPTLPTGSHNQGVVGKLNGSSDGWGLNVTPTYYSAPHAVDAVRKGLGVTEIWGTTTMRTDRWYHVAMTHDATTTTVYLNGIAEMTVTDSFAGSAIATPFLVGTLTTGAGFFKGGIDEVAIYTTALSPTRVKAHYDAGKP